MTFVMPRALRRAPGFGLMAVGPLGLAIGANAGMFSVAKDVLLNLLPCPNADRLVYWRGRREDSARPRRCVLAAMA